MQKKCRIKNKIRKLFKNIFKNKTFIYAALRAFRLLPHGGADGRSAAYKTKKRAKKASAGQKPRPSRSTRFRRPECGGGVCQLGGWLGCTFYDGTPRYEKRCILYVCTSHFYRVKTRAAIVFTSASVNSV